MELLPIPDGCADRHKAGIRKFVVADLVFRGAGLSQFGDYILSEGRNQLLLVVAGAHSIAKPDRPTADAFLQQIEVRNDRSLDRSEVRQIQFLHIERANFADRLLPQLDLQLWWNEGRDGRT